MISKKSFIILCLLSLWFFLYWCSSEPTFTSEEDQVIAQQMKAFSDYKQSLSWWLSSVVDVVKAKWVQETAIRKMDWKSIYFTNPEDLMYEFLNNRYK